MINREEKVFLFRLKAKAQEKMKEERAFSSDREDKGTVRDAK